MALKLDRCQRWLHVSNRLQEDTEIRVNSSSRHCNYYAAWKYVTKEDVACLQSEGHPDLADALPPRTAQASEARTRLEAPDNGKITGKKCKSNRLTAYEVSQMAVSRGIKTRVELLANCTLFFMSISLTSPFFRAWRYLYAIRFITRLMVLSDTCVRPHTARSLAAVNGPSVFRR